jgi:hypothetical protein
VVVTVRWHRRGADEVVARYGAHDGVVPDGARAIALGDPIGETAYALPQFRALVLGDVVIGGDAIEGRHAEGVRVCPPGWYGSTAAERAWYDGPGLPGALRLLAQEPAERLLTTHGSPLLAGGSAALSTLAKNVTGRRAA